MQIVSLKISSPDFSGGSDLLKDFTLDGKNQTPTFIVSGVPEQAVELALICHDPDAPLPRGFTHWVLYHLSPTIGEVSSASISSASSGINGFGKTGYMGPQPPEGHGLHHYYFWIYALDTKVIGEPSREEFLEKYADNIIEQNRIIGTYQR